MSNISKEDFFKRYDIDIRNGRLGGGAFGTVYKAYDNLKDEWKAVKIAEVKIINGKEFSLLSEFAAADKLPVHKNIINYESVHKFQMPNGIFDYAIMQFYPFGNWKQLVKKEQLEEDQKIELMEGLLKGLSFLHKHGVIHRDIKPSNILISERKGHFTPKIADFGLSKIIDQSDISAITNSFGGGTLEYSSPEQLLGQDLRYNADLWAFGVIAYELFLGNIPFVAKDASSSGEAKRRLIYQNIVNAPIPPEIENCPKPYDEIIRKCLVKDPSLRIKRADEALQIIQDYYEKVQTTPFASFEDEETIIISPAEREKKLGDRRQKKVEEASLDKEVYEASIAQEKREKEIRLAEVAQSKKEAETVRLASLAQQKKDEELTRLTREKEERKEAEETALKAREAKIAQEKKEQVAEVAQAKKEAARKTKSSNREPIKIIKVKRKEGNERNRGVLIPFFVRLGKLGRSSARAMVKYKHLLLYPLLLALISIGSKIGYNYFNHGPILYEHDGKFGILSFTGDTLSAPIYDIGKEYSWGSGQLIKEDKRYSFDRKGTILFVENVLTSKDEISPVKLSNNEALIDKVKTLEDLLLVSNEHPSLRDNPKYLSKLNKFKLQEDKADWDKAQNENTVQSYSIYIEATNDGSYVNQAKEKVQLLLSKRDDETEKGTATPDELYYNRVRSTNSKTALESYLQNFPQGQFANDVQREITEINKKQEKEEWNKVLSKNTISQLESFLEKYPKSSNRQAAESKIEAIREVESKNEWNRIRSSKDLSVLQNYQKRYPKSLHTNELNEIVNHLLSEQLLAEAKQVGDINLLNSLIKKYPKSSAAKKAKEELALLIEQKKKEGEEYENKEIITDDPSEVWDDKIDKAIKAISKNMKMISGGTLRPGCTDDCDDDNKQGNEVQVGSFLMARYEVRQSEYSSIMGDNPSTFSDCKSCPVENVSYYDVQKYIKKLNSITGLKYRLPTEVEWEYAARAGRKTKYSGSDDLFDVGVYRSNSNNGTQRAGSKKPNDYGLYDMSGNVHEWTDSQYSIDGYGINKKTTNEKVIRGGSWRSKSATCRVDNRGRGLPSNKNGWTGFRLVSGI